MDEIIEILNAHYQWLFSGLAITILTAGCKLLKYFFDKRKRTSKDESKNLNMSIGNGKATQIINQNNYHIENNNIVSQNKDSNTLRNDEFLLSCINHALENLNNALICLRPNKDDVVGNIEGAFYLIKESIDNDCIDWNLYFKNSTTLNVQEIYVVKKWFKRISKIIEFVSQVATTDIHKLPNVINNIVNDPTLLDVRKKLAAAVNQERS